MHDHRERADGRRRLAGLVEDLARAVAHVRSRRAHVDQVGRVHVDADVRGAQLARHRRAAAASPSPAGLRGTAGCSPRRRPRPRAAGRRPQMCAPTGFGIARRRAGYSAEARSSARSMSSRCTERVPSVRRCPGAVGPELPGERVVREAALERVLELRDELGVRDRREQLDARVEVARHQVGRADPVAALVAALEPVHARVLEEAPDHRGHADVLGDARHAGAQAADAAHVHVDAHAGLRGLVERADRARVDERVHLQHDARLEAGLVRLDRALDLAQEPLAHVVGGDDRLAVVGRARDARQRVEQLGHVLGDLAVRREEAEVLVQARRLGVVVAGADVHVVAHAAALAAHHEQRLRVRLQPGQAVHDVRARLLQRARPADVAALVEARLQLDEADGLLAALGRLDQRRDQRRVVRGAVHGHLDREHVGIAHRLLDEALDAGREGVVRVVDEDVAGAHRRHQVGGPVLAVREGGRRSRGVQGSSRSSRWPSTP